jgi:hypothetical protein
MSSTSNCFEPGILLPLPTDPDASLGMKLPDDEVGYIGPENGEPYAFELDRIVCPVGISIGGGDLAAAWR